MTDEEKVRGIIGEELLKNGYDLKDYYIFASYLEVKVVGVVGDNRAYTRPIMIEVRDAYTEAVFQMPMEILATISTRITNEIEEPSKVVYDLTKWDGKETYMEI